MTIGRRWSRLLSIGLQCGDIVGGLCQGIERCGLLLADICPGRPGDNPNELPDKLIQEP